MGTHDPSWAIWASSFAFSNTKSWDSLPFWDSNCLYKLELAATRIPDSWKKLQLGVQKLWVEVEGVRQEGKEGQRITGVRRAEKGVGKKSRTRGERWVPQLRDSQGKGCACPLQLLKPINLSYGRVSSNRFPVACWWKGPNIPSHFFLQFQFKLKIYSMNSLFYFPLISNVSHN